MAFLGDNSVGFERLHKYRVTEQNDKEMQTIISDLWSKLRNNRAFVLSLFYFACFLSYGYLLGSFGPSIVVLQQRVNSTLEENSLLVSVRAAGFFSGSAVLGFAFDRFPGNYVLSSVLFLGTAATFVMPIATNLWEQGAAMLGLGILMGGVDTGCNALLVFLHGDNVHPYFHAMALQLSIGAAISPLILEAVMSAGISFKWAWWVIALVMVAVAIVLPTFESPRPKAESDPETELEPDSSEPLDENRVGQAKETSWFDNPRHHHIWVATVVALMVAVYYGSEVATGSFLASYLRLQGLATISQSNYVVFTFWAAQSVGLACSIYISHKRANPRSMLLGNFILMAVGLIMFWAFRESLTGSWVAAVVFGLGVSSGFASMINLTQTYIDVSGKITALFAAAASVGEMTIPALVGSQMDKPNSSPMVFIGYLGLGVVVQVVLYIGLVFTAHQRPMLDAAPSHVEIDKVHDAIDKSDTVKLEELGLDDDWSRPAPYFPSEANNRSVPW